MREGCDNRKKRTVTATEKNMDICVSTNNFVMTTMRLPFFLSKI